MRKVMHHKNPKFQSKPKSDGQLRNAYAQLNVWRTSTKRANNLLHIFGMSRMPNILRMLQRRVSI